MITTLRKRTRADRFVNDVRGQQRRRIGRWVYLTLVAVFFAWLLNAFVGPKLWLRAEGIISAERDVVASPYQIQVVETYVTPGTRVTKGQLLATSRSPEVIDALATLRARYAETAAHRAELTMRKDVSTALSRYADERARENDAAFKKLKNVPEAGLISTPMLTSALRERYDAKSEEIKHEVERQSAEEQLRDLIAAQQDALAAIKQLEETYHDGAIEAPADGIVGSGVAQRGAVLRAGEPVLDIFVGEPYVLAYLDNGVFYRVSVGDHVRVSDGLRSSDGTVVEVLPMAVQLPPEFQKAFQPAARSQAVRIALDRPESFPLLSRVNVTGEGYVPGSAWIEEDALPWVEHAIPSLVSFASQAMTAGIDVVRGSAKHLVQ